VALMRYTDDVAYSKGDTSQNGGNMMLVGKFIRRVTETMRK